MQSLGFRNVTKDPVMVPKWVRGQEYVRLLTPYPRNMAMLGLVCCVFSSVF
jgi:hypothetical protein